jgi:hypothetical protein
MAHQDATRIYSKAYYRSIKGIVFIGGIMPYVPSEKTPKQLEKYGEDDRQILNPLVQALSDGIAHVAKKYKYDGAFAGELNYALTRLLQEIPRSLIKSGQIKEEIRYWIQPLMYGVLNDVALEHKRRVNVSYEAAQIVKSGDCYDTPYYTRLIEVVDNNGKHIGYQEVMVKRSDETLTKDVIGKTITKE